MSCLCFSATSPNSNPYRLVLYFLLYILTSISYIFCSCLLLSAAGFTMFLGLVPAMAYMPNSLLKLLPSIMEKNWSTAWCRNQIHYLVLCDAQSSTYEASFKGYHPQPIICKSLKNDRAAAAIADIEDEVFWKAIYCLLCAVFPALKALQ